MIPSLDLERPKTIPPDAKNTILKNGQVIGYIDASGSRVIFDDQRLQNIRAFIAEKADCGYDLESEFALGVFEAWFAEEAGRAGVHALPITLWNLRIAYNDLAERGLLPRMPSPPPAAPAKMKLPELACVAVIQSTDAERAALEELFDDPALSDHTRKQRDRKLALLAGQQRRQMSQLPTRPTREHPDGGDPPIRI